MTLVPANAAVARSAVALLLRGTEAHQVAGELFAGGFDPVIVEDARELREVLGEKALGAKERREEEKIDALIQAAEKK